MWRRFSVLATLVAPETHKPSSGSWEFPGDSYVVVPMASASRLGEGRERDALEEREGKGREKDPADPATSPCPCVQALEDPGTPYTPIPEQVSSGPKAFQFPAPFLDSLHSWEMKQP